MATDFFIKKDDQLPDLRAALKDADLAPVPISGDTVRFIMTDKASNVVKVDSPADIIDAATGIVSYAWAEADTDTAGTFKAEFEVQFNDGRLETFPNSTYLTIKITEDLGGIR